MYLGKQLDSQYPQKKCAICDVLTDGKSVWYVELCNGHIGEWFRDIDPNLQPGDDTDSRARRYLRATLAWVARRKAEHEKKGAA